MSTYDKLVKRGRKVINHHEKTLESIEWQFYRTIGRLKRRVRDLSTLLPRR